jgi:hypothetical protein
MLYQVFCCAVNHYNWQVIIVEPMTSALFMVWQNLIAAVILLILDLFRVISTEKLTWKLIEVWIPLITLT